MLAVMELGPANNDVFNCVQDRLREELEPIYEQIATDTGDPDVEMASLWLSVLTGLLIASED